MSIFVPILKDEDREHPVPTEWREALSSIANAFAIHNYGLVGLATVEPLDEERAGYIASNIKAYGCTLCELNEESWESSICSWQVGHWVVLVDLFTVEEGRSDLVLHVLVHEHEGGFSFKVHLVYVP
jgi:hypothetical protein